MSDNRRIMSRPIGFAPEDIELSSRLSPPTFGREFSMTVAEEALREAPRAMLEVAFQRLAESIAERHRGEVEAVAFSYLRDREWAEPIIHAAIVEAVREIIREVLVAPPSEGV